MSEPHVGEWVQRPGGKWHKVTTMINDRTVTYCGKEMHLKTKVGDELTRLMYDMQVPPISIHRLEVCRVCRKGDLRQ